jgi:hypothetical protein
VQGGSDPGGGGSYTVGGDTSPSSALGGGAGGSASNVTTATDAGGAKNMGINQDFGAPLPEYKSQYVAPKDYGAFNGAKDDTGMREDAAKIAEMTQGGAVNSARQGAQGAGMSAAQSAFAGARAGSNAYQSAFPAEYNALKQMGLSEQEIQNTFATNMGAQQLTKEQLANQYALGNKGLGIEQQSVANTYDLGQRGLLNQQTQQGLGAAGGALGVIGSLLQLLTPATPSDKNLKEDIEPAWGMLGKVASEVKPYYYKYTDKGKAAGGGDGERAGVMAQDLEKTPLKSSVVDTPQGKMIDTKSLTTANTAMISELSRKLDKAMAYMTKGGK